MKKISRILLALLVAIALLDIVYLMMNQAPSADLPADQQMEALIKDAGCMDCHSAEPKLPFYASWPIAKTLVKEDIEKGYRFYDMEPMWKALQEGGQDRKSVV